MTGAADRDDGREHPLEGWRVVVTGDAARSSDLAGRVAALGAETVPLAVVAIAEPGDGGSALDAATARLVAGEYQWVIVTSANAVDRVSKSLAGRSVPDAVRWAAVGPSTGRALERVGLPCALSPSGATADALASALLTSDQPATALYPRAEHVRSDLAERLRGAGWSVDDVVAYRTVAAEPDPARSAAARGADAVLFTSGSAVEQVAALLGTSDVPSVVVTIGPSTSAVARQIGLMVTAEAEPHSAEGLVTALVRTAAAADRPPR
ncbi:MAG: uroporphyrinogen-III synthase [Acidimicrobiales bacterium]|nr:uroporphyrinogen-III synthase [Acidimicrobiales bacterium]